jgi:hypothetical protein
MENLGGVGNRARIELDLAGVDDVEKIAIGTIDRDDGAGHPRLGAELIGHPVQGFEIIPVRDAHLVPRLPLVAVDGENALGDDAELGQNPPASSG